ncbi:hypothetical protein ID866_1412 [Astraeus odoratus]|nr:hypothetical protein ID866_1412 [Astraeus odoratus]
MQCANVLCCACNKHTCRRHQALHANRSQANVCQGCRKTFSRLDALNVSVLSTRGSGLTIWCLASSFASLYTEYLLLLVDLADALADICGRKAVPTADKSSKPCSKHSSSSRRRPRLCKLRSR